VSDKTTSRSNDTMSFEGNSISFEPGTMSLKPHHIRNSESFSILSILETSKLSTVHEIRNIYPKKNFHDKIFFEK